MDYPNMRNGRGVDEGWSLPDLVKACERFVYLNLHLGSYEEQRIFWRQIFIRVQLGILALAPVGLQT